jgi:hypothetical protein
VTPVARQPIGSTPQVPHVFQMRPDAAPKAEHRLDEQRRSGCCSIRTSNEESSRVAHMLCRSIDPYKRLVLVYFRALHIRVRVGVHSSDVFIRELTHEFRRDANDQ